MELDDLFQAQRQLSEKDLIIYNAELQKKSKSVGLAFFLLIFFGGLGLHKFYLGKIGEGIAYLIVGTIDFLSLQVIIFNADTYWEPSVFVYVLFGMSAIFLIFDLITLPSQITDQEKLLRIDLLTKFEIFFDIIDKFENSEDDNSIDNKDEIVIYEDDNFIDNKDGTVSHKSTGLMWQRFSIGEVWNGTTCSGDPKKINWDDATNFSSNFAGYDDWRLPTKEELMTLVVIYDGKDINRAANNFGTKKSTFNPLFFPRTIYSANKKGGFYWSSSLVSNDDSKAWFVNFYNGSSGTLNKNSNNFVRLIRQ